MRCAACETVSFALLLGGEFMLAAGWCALFTFNRYVHGAHSYCERARVARTSGWPSCIFFRFAATERWHVNGGQTPRRVHPKCMHNWGGRSWDDSSQSVDRCTLLAWRRFDLFGTVRFVENWLRSAGETLCIHIRCVLVALCVCVCWCYAQSKQLRMCVCMFELIKVNTCALPKQPSLYSGQI